MGDHMMTYSQEWQVRVTWKGSRCKHVPAKGEARHQEVDPHVNSGWNLAHQAAAASTWKLW